MVLNVIVLTGEEEFLQFLDPELVTMTETIEKNGLRTLDFEYMFQDLHEDKQLFQIGNKIWVSGDNNLTDCLYVINTPVEIDVYQKNSFSMTIEEVLVELNYAPLFTQNELTSANGFSITSSNGQQAVTIDWNALHYWFSDYFNIGVVQQCLNNAHNKITFNGTSTLMGLLRYIEEETGNIFVTRYEKDCLNNTIHRYLDFLNPLNVSKNWVLNLEYDFVSEDTSGDGVYDEDGNPSTDDYDDVEEEDDIVDFTTDYTPITNIDPTVTQFRVTNEDGLVLNNDGLIYTDEDDTPLVWDANTIGFDGSEENVVISLSMDHGALGLITNNKTFVVASSDEAGVVATNFISVYDDPVEISDTVIPDDCYFEIFDTSRNKAVFRTCINREIGHVHEQILDFGFNLENVVFETDEEDTYNAISPILSLDDSEGLTRNNMSSIISAWKSLSVSQGDIIPMIVEKVNIQASSLAAAKTSLGTFSRSTNYWSRPYRPQDNIDSNTASNSTWEFWRATAYWSAPFTKQAGQLHLTSNSTYDNEYTTIYGKPDVRDDYLRNTPKMGTVETSDEDIFAIYNDVAMKLKEKRYREFNIQVDVADLRKEGSFNDYSLHDKVYVKLPDYTELVSARVTKTSKEAHDIAKNTIELSNFTNNVIKTLPAETCINASNVSFKYPNSKSYSVRLENLEWDEEDPYSIRYPANKFISFAVYKVDNGSETLTKYTYNKTTDANGYATINMAFDPGDYKLRISFGGDEEYGDASLTVDVNVSGVKEVNNPVNTKNYRPANLPKAKTTKKSTNTKKKVKKVKRYYTKYGVSPEEDYIMGIGRPSAGGELAKYGYNFYKTVFVRKCPMCGSRELYWSIFWAGNETGNWGKFPATGRRESGSAEGQIFCKKCDADYSIFGHNHNSAHKDLKVYKKPVKVKKADAYTLKKGKMYYDTYDVTVKKKKVESNKTRTTSTSINENVKKLALSIVGNSEGLAAAKKIAAWCGSKKHLKYDYYPNFCHNPKSVMNRKAANCCDSARFMLTLMDAAGCSEKLKLQYVHVVIPGTNTGHVFAKVTTRSTGKWRYVDPVLKFENGRNPWAHWYKGCGTTIAHVSNYPTLPFG